jgi:CheY-like chemotaxis protein
MPSFKILLADNSPRVRTVVSKQLELLGLPPDLSEDGQQAVAAATDKIYHLIFMAVIMPNLDGLEATKQIRKFEQDAGRSRTPIIGVTGYTGRSACIRAGMDDFLFKPVSIEQLTGALKNFGFLTASR